MERFVTELADAQYGVVGRAQLLARGAPVATIDGWVRRDRLRLVYRGAYALGHAELRPEGFWKAALLACGPGVAIGGASGLQVLGHLPFRPGRVEVVTRRHLRGQPGLVVRHTERLARSEVIHRRGLAVTTLPRCLLDHAERVDYAELRRVADIPAELDLVALRRCLERNPGRRGARAIRRLLAREEARTKSAFERRFLAFCHEHGLPFPDHCNGNVGPHKVDCRYDRDRLVIELDGRAYHQQRAQMRRDRHRDSDLQLAGWWSLRLVWEDLDPEWAQQTVDRIRATLALGPPLVGGSSHRRA